MRAWLTPDSGAFLEATVCRQIAVPWPLLPYVTGCLELLAEVGNWEDFGSATPEETADFFREVLDVHVDSICGGGMFNDGNFQTLVNGDYLDYPSGVIDIPIASLPAGVGYGSVLLLQNLIKCDTGTITFQALPLGFGSDPNKTVYETVAGTGRNYQTLAYVGEGGLRIYISPNQTVQWELVMSLVGWW